MRTAEQAVALEPRIAHALTSLAFVYGQAGRRSEAMAAILRLAALPDVSPAELPGAYAGLGEADRLFPLLERAVEERDPIVLDVGVDPNYDSCRGDPRMRHLLERMNLPVVRD